MKSIYQVIFAFLVVIVCVARTCQAYGLDQAELRRETAQDALDDQELYEMIETLAHGVSKRGSVKHLGLANVDNWRMMKNVNRLRNLLNGGKRSDQLAVDE